MVYSLVVVSAIVALAATVFFGLVADAYRHVPAKAKVDVRHETRKRR